MSSEILTEHPPKGGSSRTPVGPPVATKDEGFHPTHFFVLVSLLAATVAVVLARPAGPENLILISLTIGAVGLASYGFYRTLLPLVSPSRAIDREPLSARLRADLEREKALTLRSIKELEFDKAMGKLSDRDFEEMSGRLRARAMGIMKQLEARTGVYRAQIEKDLATRMGSARPASRAAAACSCGTTNDPDARFCKNCGMKLEAA
jgi:zinc ribbon protein